MKKTILKICFASAISLASYSTLAQSFDFLPPSGNFIGAGMGIIPEYTGSNKSVFGILPGFRKELGDYRNITYYGGYMNGNIMSDKHFRFGPSINYRFSRSNLTGDAKNLSDIDAAIELGVFMNYETIINNNFRHRFIIGTEVLSDVSGVSNGYNVNMYARYWRPVSEAVDIVAMSSVIYGDGNYNDTYFSVSNADSLATGLSTYKAGSGFNEMRLSLGMMLHLSKEWHIGGGVRYGRVLGNAADSPIVKDIGDKNQYTFGLGVGYLWQ